MAKTEKKTVSQETIDKVGGADKLRRVDLPLDDDGNEILEVVVCVPDRRTMGQYLKYQNVNPAKAQDILVKNCLLTDKETVLADDALFLTCVSALAEMIPIRENKIKKY
ncbi:hypothetical protein LNQ49_12765 [Flavobacterium sp. F-65]|uniref:Phage tail assembly chaperone protein, E, or 41 or 14 n=1 Tax=Flavobacterium pisciphilum TaxID=2893755 RepID=A0ABS8MUL9_9FLAO|nr:hypothetical protein [Flavobacterium sp. F-65]MCC9072455.1 hypothetical protein [Flavobacterium sp. F-65]